MTPATRMLLTWLQRHRTATITHAKLGSLLGLSRNTVGSALADLTARGLITVTVSPKPTGGRTASTLTMNPKVSAPRLFAVGTAKPSASAARRQTALDTFRERFVRPWEAAHGQPYIITNYQATLGQWARFVALVPTPELQSAVVAAYLADRDASLRERGYPFSSMLVDWRIQGYLLTARRQMDAAAYDAALVDATAVNESRWSLRDLLEASRLTRHDWRWFRDVVAIDTGSDSLTLVFDKDSPDLDYATKHFVAELARAAGRPVLLRRAS